MRSDKTNERSQAIDDKFLAVLFGTDSDVVNPFTEQEWIVKIRSGLPGAAITTWQTRSMSPKRMLPPGCIPPPEQFKGLLKPTLPLDLNFPTESHSSSACIVAVRMYSRMIKSVSLAEDPKLCAGQHCSNHPARYYSGMELVLDELGRIEHGIFI